VRVEGMMMEEEEEEEEEENGVRMKKQEGREIWTLENESE
jgi:hypothetical protein